MGIATRLKLARLVAFVPEEHSDLEELVGSMFAGGADAVVLVQDKLAPITDPKPNNPVTRIREQARATQGLTAFQGRPVAGAMSSPDLLILDDDRAAASRARKLAGEFTQIGRHCTTAAEVDAALADEDIDFLTVGPGLDLIRHAAKAAPQADPTSKPWFAVGGITANTIDAVLKAGALRIGVGAAIAKGSDPEGVTRGLKDRMRRAWNAEPRMEAVTSAAFGRQANLDLTADVPVKGTDLTL